MQPIKPICKASGMRDNKDSYPTVYVPKKKNTSTVLSIKFSDVLKKAVR